MRRALRAERYLAGSRFLVRSFTDAGWLPADAPVEVLSYGLPYARPEMGRREETPRLPLRFGFVGALMPHKGAHVAVEAFRGVAPSEAGLKLWGNASADPAYTERLLVGAGAGSSLGAGASGSCAVANGAMKKLAAATAIIEILRMKTPMLERPIGSAVGCRVRAFRRHDTAQTCVITG